MEYEKYFSIDRMWQELIHLANAITQSIQLMNSSCVQNVTLPAVSRAPQRWHQSKLNQAICYTNARFLRKKNVTIKKHKKNRWVYWISIKTVSIKWVYILFSIDFQSHWIVWVVRSFVHSMIFEIYTTVVTHNYIATHTVNGNEEKAHETMKLWWKRFDCNAHIVQLCIKCEITQYGASQVSVCVQCVPRENEKNF